jgi:hypothetical protein
VGHSLNGIFYPNDNNGAYVSKRTNGRILISNEQYNQSIQNLKSNETVSNGN